MFERFTNRARHVVVLAQEEAGALRHNYIGTEHILLGLLGEPGGIAAQVLDRFGITLTGAREEVKGLIGVGKGAMSGHIPFTPRAKKTLELALREALQLRHNYIGTEHILLGLIREDEGVAAQVMRQHGELTALRSEVLALVPPGQPESARDRRRWLRRMVTAEFGEPGGPGEAGEPGPQGETTELRTTPAADTSLDEAARLAGSNPVGSHHLLLAALGDSDSAAARALASLGVDLDRTREALRHADVVGTSDEPPEEAGGRQMLIRVSDDRVIVEATDQTIVRIGRAALDAIGDAYGSSPSGTDPSGTIRGDLPASASLSNVWQALRDSLEDIRQRHAHGAEPPDPAQPRPAGPETGAA